MTGRLNTLLLGEAAGAASVLGHGADDMDDLRLALINALNRIATLERHAVVLQGVVQDLKTRRRTGRE